MIKQPKFIVISVGLLLILVISAIVLAVEFSDYRTKHFTETMDLDVDKIDKIEISSPSRVGESKRTSKRSDVKKLMDYLDQFQYKRLNGDQTARMPMKASIIYIYIDDRIEFIVPYGPEAMITYKVYQIKEGPVESDFIVEFYEEIEDEKEAS